MSATRPQRNCRVRLYVDESGDANTPNPKDPLSKYLCVVGVEFLRDQSYVDFCAQLETLKATHLPPSDVPIVLHRVEICSRKGVFGVLKDPAKQAAFDRDVLRILAESQFTVYGVVVDKEALDTSSRRMKNPYEYSTVLLLERYCGRLKHLGNRGDVVAEARGTKEDRILRKTFRMVVKHGYGFLRDDGQYLIEKDIQFKRKTENVGGLQVADLLARDVMRQILHEYCAGPAPKGFGAEMLACIEPKFNRQLYNGTVDGYGKIFRNT